MSVAFATLALLLLLPAMPLALELLTLSLAALLPARRLATAAGDLALAVIVPAHNEEQLIGACVASLHASATPLTRVYVVAHNCSDHTAANARAAGATVLELYESSGHGKGAALHHGFTQALAAGAAAVMVVDADSTVSANLVPATIAALRGGSRALQCRYMAAKGATTRTRLQGLALLGMNVLRPRGRSRLGLSCGIFGNGFALAAETLERVPYTAHSVVEDLEYHLLLVRAGLRVDYVDDARVLGEMPDHAPAARTQRARWEGGRSLMRRRHAMPLLQDALRGKPALLEPALDLLSLPLASGAMLAVASLLLALAAHGMAMMVAAGTAIAGFVLYVVVAAVLGDDPMANLASLVAAPLYIAFKLATLPATRRAARKNAEWVRTGRNQP